jgi:hypothetical protein
MISGPPLLPQVETTFQVGRRYRVTMILRADGQFTADWHPDLPRSMSKQEWRDYRRGRDALLAELS